MEIFTLAYHEFVAAGLLSGYRTGTTIVETDAVCRRPERGIPTSCIGDAEDVVAGLEYQAVRHRRF